jgi:anti-sigma regulatory factor (Ser/Thr protein kinase)
MSHSPAEHAPGPAAAFRDRPVPWTRAQDAAGRGGPELELVLAPDGPGLAHARETIRDRLARWEVTAVGDDLVLAAHELIANAVRHGCTSPDDVITIAMSRVEGHVVVAVYDPSPQPPTVREPSDDAETGRGLPLVMSLCDRWGVLPTPNGKCVWLTRAITDADVSHQEEVRCA